MVLNGAGCLFRVTANGPEIAAVRPDFGGTTKVKG